MNEEKIKRGKQIIKELADILQELSDSEVGKLLSTEATDNLLRAILDPSKVKKYPSIAEFLLANKTRASLLALMRYTITQNYSFKSINMAGHEVFFSPEHNQWVEDGVIFLLGEERFAGAFVLYRNKEELRFAKTTREMIVGEQPGPENIIFIDRGDALKLLETLQANEISDLDKPIHELKELLEGEERDESKYQKWIQKHDGVLGLQYESVQSHRKLDDENIPDFTGVRVNNKNRDIFEIKQPFLSIFRKDGNFTSEFNDAWNQIERYLTFVREEKGYLGRKGLNFDNPKCYLIIGFMIPDDGVKKIRAKERLNPAIEILTYNDLMIFAEQTIEFVKNPRDRV
jgi:hypothetical protein